MDALRELHDKGMNLRNELKQFNLDKEETVLSNEDSKRVSNLIAEIDANDQAIQSAKGQEELRQKAIDRLAVEEEELRQAFDSSPKSSDPLDRMTAEEKKREAFLGWIAEPTQAGSNELQQRCMTEFGIRANAKTLELKLPNKRTMSTTTDSQGGYTVPTLLHDQIIESRDKFNPWFGLGTVLRTESGAPYEIPTNDDTGNAGDVYAENAAISNTDPSFGAVTLNAYKYASDIVKCPWELLRDSAFNMEEFLGGILGKRIGRKSNEHFTSGDGSAKAHGITATAGNSGVVFDAGGAVTYAKLVDTQLALTEPYDENASWMFNRTVLGWVMKVVDGQSRPIFMPSLVPGAPGTLLGKPYYTNPHMPVGNSSKCVVYGDLSQQYIREVGSLTFQRLDELYAADGQVGFVAWQSLDSELLDAGDDPVVYATAGS